MGLQSSTLPAKVSRLTGDRLQHIHRLLADHGMIKAENYHHLFSLLLSQQRALCHLFFHPLLITDTHKKNLNNWLQSGVNHCPFKRIVVLNMLPPSKSLLLNKGVKRCFCLPSLLEETGSLKDTNEHENGNKVPNSQ